jgi:hypothetical protein
MSIRSWAVLAFAMALSACASIQPVVKSAALPEATSAYVTGNFTRIKSGGFAFVLRNLDSGLEYGMPLGEDSLLPTDVTDQVIAIKVPPGRYSVAQWFTYGTLTKERTRKKDISNTFLNAPFVLEKASVVHIGSHLITTTYTPGYPTSRTDWLIKPQPITSKDAQGAFNKAYPAFANLAFMCHMCVP